MAEKQKTREEPIDAVRDPAAIPKVKKGRPMGWRKESGVSYGDFARMSATEKGVPRNG